jgi:hypothetical protein
MPIKPIKLVRLAAALAALPGAAAILSPPAEAKQSDPKPVQGINANQREDIRPNVFIAVGRDLLGMIVRKSSDGIVTADHYSHSSHASHESHSSHSSHYSGG